MTLVSYVVTTFPNGKETQTEVKTLAEATSMVETFNKGKARKLADYRIKYTTIPSRD